MVKTAYSENLKPGKLPITEGLEDLEEVRISLAEYLSYGGISDEGLSRKMSDLLTALEEGIDSANERITDLETELSGLESEVGELQHDSNVLNEIKNLIA